MSLKRQLFKTIKQVSKYLSKNLVSAIKKQVIWLLRTLLITKRRRGSVNAGFVLPTVVMVSLVVVLLTTAILFRSFERAKNASNVRVNEVTMQAATPALERARAKLNALLEDPTLPRGTPSDSALYDVFKKDKYTLGDETRLKLAFEFNGAANIQQNTTSIESDETLKTAWKFAVDTDNNGLKDTFTLYGIYFRSPSRDSTTGQFNRERKPLDARTPPMDSSSNQQCSSAAGFSSLVGNSSWYKLNSGNLGKSFFIYTVNVPITELGSSLSNTEYEPYKGNKSVVALELQQDRSRVPLPNNAVWFENDLEIITGSTALLLNGRVQTNGNLLVGVTSSGGNITFRQVSSKTSCFYNEENGLISVGGNVGNGSLSQTSTQNVNVDLYKGFGNAITTAAINGTNKSTNSIGGGSIGFNDAAFNQRIAAMKSTAITLCTTCNSATNGSALKTAVDAISYPSDVKDNVTAKVKDVDDGDTARQIFYNEIEIYLRNRTRRVPFAEVADATGVGATTGYSAITANLEPQATWREPLDSSNQLTGVTGISVDSSQLEAIQPILQKKEGVQSKLGDRVLVGNNLPALWKQNNQYVGSEANQPVLTSSGGVQNWTRYGSESPARWRNTRIQALADLGILNRNGFWEENAAANPINDLDSVGGVRIVTGAGIYVDDPDVGSTTTGALYDRPTLSFLPDPPDPTPSDSSDIPVWPDTMPMSSPGDTRQGDLLMRATAVYHYKVDYGTDQEPIACVSSYYDPSDENTSQNKTGITVPPIPPAVTPTIVNLPWNAATNGKSNNGIVYNYPTDGRSTFFNTHKARLQRQANLKFPNGRWANKPLRDALTKIGTATTVPSTGLQLADYSAVDTALCAISILGNEAGFVVTPANQPKHGAIKEATFLDAREVKQISTSTAPSTYDLDLEQRQPLEIRVTDIDLGSSARGIATTAITANEYLLPYSGILYATRDDALPDESDTTAESKLLSPTDFRLDPTRHPNGIRLIEGETLARTTTNTYNAKEKGLILVTDLPAYIKGKFNLHQATVGSGSEIEEFTEAEPTTNFYDRSTANTKFACRINRTGCSTTASEGDFWRSATIIADSMTLLSGNFADGVRRFGDYDLNNNTGIVVEDGLLTTSIPTPLDDRRRDRLKNGFWENNFATSSYWTDNGIPRTAAINSYLVNGVTPLQRRITNHPLYVMEICRKLPVSTCGSGDWVVGFDINGDGVLSTTLQTYTVNGSNIPLVERDIKTYKLGQAIAAAAGSTTATTTALSNWSTAFSSAFPSSWYVGSSCSTSGITTTCNKSIRDRLGTGDTSNKLSLQQDDRRYARRVAFARYDSNNLVESSPGSRIYKPMGVSCPLDTTGTVYTDNGCTGTNYGYKSSSIRSLWFRTTNSTTDPGDIAEAVYASDKPLFYYPPIDGNDADTDPDLDGQPLLVPVLQIHDATSNPPNLRTDASTVASGEDFRTNWLQQPIDTTFNATFVLGNSPSRTAELSAGLQNFVRFLENWNGRTAKISGSFIQLKRSAFSTAPAAPIFTIRQSTTATATPTTANLSLFDYALDNYPTRNSDGLLPYYSPPDRKWGFDVGLLSEQPDLFAQRFTAPSTGRPNEFFREVGRDDTWVKTLLCAGQPASGGAYTNAVPNEYRPSGCPSIPND
ncbi:hormogonium polysaccharide biosynthesis protein HpsA [Halotia wernerae UHCC 0503]|nr:hormogonium polysaccharide biosynthesis protein HpsA [Halotia wernerae UHCC 0503]